jgi:hypothetical protein
VHSEGAQNVAVVGAGGDHSHGYWHIIPTVRHGQRVRKHALLGHIDWAFALPLCVAVIPGARVGAHLAIRSSDRALRLSVAIVLGSIAIVYAAGEIIALV